MKRFIILGIILVVIALTLVGWRWFRGAETQASYRISKVERGDIIQTVNATGIVQPTKLVQVGTQVSGPVKKLYADFNSRVKVNEIVAQIDPAIYDAQVAQNKASLIRSEAEVERVRVNLVLAEKELIRSKELASRDLISESELDTTIANRDSLLAQLKLAQASVEQSKSTLQMSDVNLGYTTIKSPVDGVVISRNVDEGQTVVANLSAQTIFVIATDLKKVRIEASIPEADIGKITVGQTVIFTVDAYPDIKFSGEVAQVRLSPNTVQNVVTYTVIISAENPDEKLFPGMTANLTLEVDKRTNVLKVPNAALRFTPDSSLIEESEPITLSGEAELAASGSGSFIDRQHSGISSLTGRASLGSPVPDGTSSGEQSRRGVGAPTELSGMRSMRARDGSGVPREDGQGRRRAADRATLRHGKIWLQTEKKLLKSIYVMTGISDGSFTEVISKNLSEGQEIVTGIMAKGDAEKMVNPFMPQRPGGAARRTSR